MKFLIALFFSLLSSFTFGNDVKTYFLPALSKTIAIADYDFFNDGTVLDKKTNLVWSRCYHGQIFNNNGTPDNYKDDKCDGEPRSYAFWQDVMADVAKQSDWRLPSVNEFKSTQEHACLNYYTVNLNGNNRTYLLEKSRDSSIFIMQWFEKSYVNDKNTNAKSIGIFNEVTSTIAAVGIDKPFTRLVIQPDGTRKRVSEPLGTYSEAFSFPNNTKMIIFNSDFLGKVKQDYPEYAIDRFVVRWVKDNE